MDFELEYAAREVGRAVSILATGRARILERLNSARDEALSHVNREHIPEKLRQQFDQIMAQMADIGALTEDEGSILATQLLDLSATLDDEFFNE